MIHKKVLYIVFLSLLAWTCYAATVYVDTDCSNGISTYNPGGDACTGGSDTVYSSIQNAADAVASGIVEIRAGTYTEQVDFDANSGPGTTPQSDGSYIVFKPYSGESVTVTTSNWVTLIILESWIKIEGLIVKNTNSNGHNIIIGGGTDPDTDGSSNNWIYNNEVDGASTSDFGIQIISQYCLTCAFDDNIIENNTVHDLNGEGVYFNLYTNFSGTYDNNQIIGNTIYGCYEAIQMSHETGAADPPTNSVVRGNTIYGNGGAWGCVYCSGSGTLCEDNIIHDNTCSIGGLWVYGNNITIRNNLIYDNDGSHSADAGIVADGNYTGIEIYYNTIERQGTGGVGDGIRLNSSGITATVKNNIVANNAGAGLYDEPGSTMTCSNNVRYNNGSTDKTCTDDQTGDPSFVSVVDGSEDYHLQSGSSAIENGVNVSITDDIEGVTRVGYDIGAYEFDSAVYFEGVSIQ